MDWFLYDNGLRYERVKQYIYFTLSKYMPLSLRQDRHMVSNIIEQSPKSVLKTSLYY